MRTVDCFLGKNGLKHVCAVFNVLFQCECMCICVCTYLCVPAHVTVRVGMSAFVVVCLNVLSAYYRLISEVHCQKGSDLYTVAVPGVWPSFVGCPNGHVVCS